MFRRTVAGLALFAWPLFEFLAFLTSPPDADHDPDIFRTHATSVQVSALLYIWATLSLIPVILGLAHLLRERAPRAGGIGAALGLVGAGHGLTLFTTDFYDLALALSLSDAQAKAITKQVGEMPGFVFGMLLPGFLLHIGLYTLLITLAVVRIAPWWVPVVALVGTVVPFVTMGQPPVVQSTGALLHLATYGWIGLRVLRMSEAEWRGGVGEVRAPLPGRA
ncbi:hypothetical protein GCM10010517_72740 [Streptosporangium fragile]|uniref:DUF4386 domain-containing protein n=1 Tax=Streptosporangium fragile TaxID=46186 RepID=A0ABN3WA03_9ACTN